MRTTPRMWPLSMIHVYAGEMFGAVFFGLAADRRGRRCASLASVGAHAARRVFAIWLG